MFPDNDTDLELAHTFVRLISAVKLAKTFVPQKFPRVQYMHIATTANNFVQDNSIDSTLTKDWQQAYRLIVTSRSILIMAHPLA